MIRKCIKIGVASAIGLVLAAGVLFGTDAGSYLWTSARSVQSAVPGGWLQWLMITQRIGQRSPP